MNVQKLYIKKNHGILNKKPKVIIIVKKKKRTRKGYEVRRMEVEGEMLARSRKGR